MKSITIAPLLALLLCYGFTGVQCQEEANRRFEEFLERSLQNLSSWVVDKGFAPDPLNGDGAFALNSSTSGSPSYTIKGEFKNRFYHGAEQNISKRNIVVNLDDYAFTMDFFYGGGSSDSIRGEYLVEGDFGGRIPVHGSGNFSRTNQLTESLHHEQHCAFEAKPDGYFDLVGCAGTNWPPRFENLNLDDFDAGGLEWNIEPVILSWYDMELMDFPSISFYWYIYMREVFAVTPIEEIIGTTLPPTVSSASELNSPVPARSSEKYFDSVNKRWMQRFSVGNYVFKN